MADPQAEPAVEEAMAREAEQERASRAADGVDPAEVLEADLTALMQRLQEQEQVAAENHDRYLRTLADFENFRRRSRQEMEDARRFAGEKLISDLLPVLDDFERALQHSEGSAGAEAVREGVLQIQKLLLDTLAKHGVEPVEAVGQPFDPQLHEAIMRVEPGPDRVPGTVAEELRRGYTLHGRLVRPSLVKVVGE
jgi:molecular chaperone GrpE